MIKPCCVGIFAWGYIWFVDNRIWCGRIQKSDIKRSKTCNDATWIKKSSSTTNFVLLFEEIILLQEILWASPSFISAPSALWPSFCATMRLQHLVLPGYKHQVPPWGVTPAERNKYSEEVTHLVESAFYYYERFSFTINQVDAQLVSCVLKREAFLSEEWWNIAGCLTKIQNQFKTF